VAPEPHQREPVMKNVATYVGIDAHKKDLFVAMLIGNEPKPVTWQLANEPNAVRRLVLCLATAGDDDIADHVRRGRAGADSAQAG